MNVTITPTQFIEPAALCGGLAAAGLHDVTVTAVPKKRLEVTCRDDELEQVVAAIAHDGRIKAVVICANNVSGQLRNLTLRSCL